MSTIQDRMKEVTQQFIGELEGYFDDFLINWKELKFYKILHNLGVKSNHAKMIIKHAQKNIDEYELALSGKDTQLEEGYSNYTRVQLKKMSKWWESIIVDCNSIVDEGKTLRKYNTARNKRLRALDIKPQKTYNKK